MNTISKKQLPENVGTKWTQTEENLLLEELNQNIDVATIAKNHNRTVGGINARRKVIAYKLFTKSVSMDDIINKTKLNKEQIEEEIKKREPVAAATTTAIESTPEKFTLENEITQIKNDIRELNNKMNKILYLLNQGT
jgi:predicted  nucleic acid-binding Zn-ribbon protein